MKCLFPIIFLTSFLFAETQTVAISYFDNTSGLEEYNPLSKGLADMLITDLSNVKSIQIVEREKLESLLKEIDLGEGKFMDESTAQKLGKGLGASYMLTGSYLIIGEIMRIDARLLDVGTGEVFMSEEITGKKDVFFKLEKDLVDKLIATLEIELSRTESRNIKKVQTESFDSFNAYSSALVEYDNGNIEESIKYLEKATESDEDFDIAWEKLEDLEEIINNILKVHELGLDTKSLDILERLNNKDLESFTDLNTICASMMVFNSSPIDFYRDNELYKGLEGVEVNINDSLRYEIENNNNIFYAKLSKSINFFTQVIDIMESNGLMNELYYTQPIAQLIYTWYLALLDGVNMHFLNYSDLYYGVPEVLPDILDAKSDVIFIGEDINKVIIKIGTRMMQKYPHGLYFSGFQVYVERAIDSEKNK